jgi:hypothetical protein
MFSLRKLPVLCGLSVKNHRRDAKNAKVSQRLCIQPLAQFIINFLEKMVRFVHTPIFQLH